MSIQTLKLTKDKSPSQFNWCPYHSAETLHTSIIYRVFLATRIPVITCKNWKCHLFLLSSCLSIPSCFLLFLYYGIGTPYGNLLVNFLVRRNSGGTASCTLMATVPCYFLIFSLSTSALEKTPVLIKKKNTKLWKHKYSYTCKYTSLQPKLA